MSFDRRGVLGAVLAVPAALTLGAASAAPAVAAAGGVEAGEWTDLVLASGVTAAAGATPQVRLVTIAGTAFLQARGSISCNLTADTKVASLPAGFALPTWYVRATAPRNNSAGINACRFEINLSGAVSLYGGTAGNPITWAQFDSVQSIWR
ncbi:hypothetical protein ACFY8P_06200 [Streptomyces sp. NPDC012693]|jgi:hypothetical protein|uniref:hypothetical protein n=1 Tax=unclassified Streptomyces TaxID=2593676 RepID=UPI00202F30B3|nr:hypothetical protein [Streptomyces sp. MSC1_001]